MKKPGLLTSAKAFLTEALENFGAGKRDLAIVHAVIAVELVLKERLARINSALILENIDTPVPGKFRTVQLKLLPQRLANLGIPLGRHETTLIAAMAEWRNQIVHHVPSYNLRAAERQLRQLLDFLATTLRQDFKIPLETFLPRKLYREAHRLLADWQKAIQAAQKAAAAEGEVIAEPCPDCGATAVMSLRVNARVFCHLCRAQLFRCESCNACGRRVMLSYEPEGAERYCAACVDATEDMYIQHQIDIARGK